MSKRDIGQEILDGIREIKRGEGTRREVVEPDAKAAREKSGLTRGNEMDVKKRLARNRPMTSVTLRMPEDVVEDLKRIALLLGFSGYQPLIRQYIGQGLRVNLARLEDPPLLGRLVESLKRHGVDEALIADAMAEALPEAHRAPDARGAEKMTRSRSYQTELLEALRDPEEAAEYLNAALEEGDAEAFLLALRDVAETRGEKGHSTPPSTEETKP